MIRRFSRLLLHFFKIPPEQKIAFQRFHILHKSRCASFGVFDGGAQEVGHDGIAHQGIHGAAALIEVFFVGFEIVGRDGGLPLVAGARSL